MKKALIVVGGIILALLAWDLVFPPRMPPPDSKMADGTPYIVTRTVTRGCPTGYVDHPHNPDWCALPAVSERILARARR